MLICIPRVLNSDEVAKVFDGIESGEYADGALSAGEFARGVKRNLEFQRVGGKMTEMDRIFAEGLTRCEAFRDFAMPKQVAPPIFSRYDSGMEYGLHVDSPIMGQASPIRSDLSMTLFLNDPASYDGGELTIDTGFGEQTVKLPAGDAVVYPSTTLHRVAPVTRGARVVALTWIQSVVRDEGIRAVLYDIALTMRRLSGEAAVRDPKELEETRNILHRAYANLMRRSADV